MRCVGEVKRNSLLVAPFARKKPFKAYGLCTTAGTARKEDFMPVCVPALSPSCRCSGQLHKAHLRPPLFVCNRFSRCKFVHARCI